MKTLLPVVARFRKFQIQFLMVLTLALSFGEVPAAFAYDVDTHYYATHLMARYAGIGPEVAGYLATGNAWIDVSMTTTPMGGPILGSRMRRLYHFPGNRRHITSTAHGQKLSFAFATEAKPNHPLASEAIMEGMRTGNLLQTSGGLHTLNDSWGHAGYLAESGHAYDGHWPDRPWIEPEKYEEMVRTFFKALVAIRKLLPQEALDHDLSDRDGIPNAERSAEELAEMYLSRPDVRDTYRRDIFKEPLYIRSMISYLIGKAAKMEAVLPGVDLWKYVPEDAFSGERDAQSVANEMVRSLMDRQLLHGEHIFKPGTLHSIAPDLPLDRLSPYEIGIDHVVKRVVDELTDVKVPEMLSEMHKVEVEEENILRQTEMAIRISNWQNLIQSMVGEKPYFKPQTLLTEMTQAVRRFAEIVKLKKPVETFAELEELKKSMREGAEMMNLSPQDQARWIGIQLKFAWLDWAIHGKSRMVADSTNLLYQHERTFKELIEDGTVKQLLTLEELDTLKRLRKERLAKAGIIELNRPRPAPRPAVEPGKRLIGTLTPSVDECEGAFLGGENG